MLIWFLFLSFKLTTKLEAIVEEVLTGRVNGVKGLIEKEFSHLNKLAIDHIKIKKKALSSSEAYTKEEMQRLTREIEKDSVDFAVRENSKMEEFLASKRNKIKSSLQPTYKEINDLKKTVSCWIWKMNFSSRLKKKKHLFCIESKKIWNKL